MITRIAGAIGAWILFFSFFLITGCGGGGAIPASVPAPVATAPSSSGPATQKGFGLVVIAGGTLAYNWGQVVSATTSANVVADIPFAKDLATPGIVVQSGVLASNPAVVVIQPEPFSEMGDITQLVIEAQTANVKVVLGTAPPVDTNVRQWNQQLLELAHSYGIQVADYTVALTNADGSLNTTLIDQDGSPTIAGFVAMWAVLCEPLDDDGVIAE